MITLFVSTATGAMQHHYDLQINLDEASVRVQGKLAAPANIASRLGRMRDLQHLEDCDGRPLAADRQRQRLAIPAQSLCFRYTTALRLVAGRMARRVQMPQGVWLISPSEFMWLPPLAPHDRVQVQVTVHSSRPGQSTAVSLPWKALATHLYEIAPSPRSDTALAVVGNFHALKIPGLSSAAAFVGPAQQRAKMQAWLASNAHVFSREFGALPNPHAQLVLLHTPSRGPSPVPFGHVIRDQGETVRLFVDSDRSAADLNTDWTAAHELAHLLLPYVDRKWLSEGFASYYQNVLQARRGFYSETDAWRRLTGSFAKAARSGANLSPNDTEQADFWRARMMIYWSGAAFALLADSQLRAEHGSSLDATLAKLARCCLPAGSTWAGPRLMRQLDELSQTRVFTSLYTQWADHPGMPPTDALLRRLGVRLTAGQVSLDDTAPWADVRRQIMQPAPETSSATGR